MNSNRQHLESHFTATGVVLNIKRDKVLLIFHKKLQKWLPAGGHVDIGELPHEAAVREVFEETGIKAEIIDACINLNLDGSTEVQMPTPITVFHEFIPAHQDKPEHMHYDFIYILSAKYENFNPKLGEICQLGWFGLDELSSLDATDGTRKLCQQILSKFKLNNF